MKFFRLLILLPVFFSFGSHASTERGCGLFFELPEPGSLLSLTVRNPFSERPGERGAFPGVFRGVSDITLDWQSMSAPFRKLEGPVFVARPGDLVHFRYVDWSRRPAVMKTAVSVFLAENGRDIQFLDLPIHALDLVEIKKVARPGQQILFARFTQILSSNFVGIEDGMVRFRDYLIKPKDLYALL